MVCEIRTDARQVDPDRDPDRTQVFRRSDA
jgi:hypothetical protein